MKQFRLEKIITPQLEIIKNTISSLEEQLKNCSDPEEKAAIEAKINLSKTNQSLLEQEKTNLESEIKNLELDPVVRSLNTP